MTEIKKKYFDFQFELQIDGAARPPTIAAALFQTDPFPAGHQYQLTISGKRLGKLFTYLELGKQARVSEEVVRRCFLTLGWLLPANAPEAGVDIEYFLNSIERIEYGTERILFFGVCSPVVAGK